MSVSTLDKIALGVHGAGQRIWRSLFVRDVLTLSGGVGIAQLIALAILPVLTRLYSPADFGLLVLYISIVTVLSIFAGLQYELTIILSRSHRSASQLVWLVLAISICAAGAILVVVFLFRHQIANLLGAPELAAWLWTAPALMVITGIYRVLNYWKIRLRQFGVVAQSSIVRAVVFAAIATVVAFIPLATTLKGAGLIIAFIFSEIAKMLVLLLSVRNRDRKQFAPADRRRVVAVGRRHGPMAVTMFASHGLENVYGRIPDLMINSFFGAVALGHYGMVNRVIAVPTTLVANSIRGVFLQRASILHRKGGQFAVPMLKVVGATALISFVPFIVAIIFAPTFFSIVLGAEWELAGRYASILLVGEFIAFIVAPTSCGAFIVNDRRFIFLIHLARLLLTLSLLPVVYLGLLDFVDFLWGLVGIRILVNAIGGLGAFMCAKLGRPVTEPPYPWKLSKAEGKAANCG